MRFILLLLAICVAGCVEESETEPETPVRETGYVECTVSADCNGDLRCTTADGEAECVETEGMCFADLCECWANTYCAQGDVCVPGEQSFECIAPSAVEFPLTTVRPLGVCAVPGADTQVEISLLVGADGRVNSRAKANLSPTDLVEGLDTPLGEALTAESFSFEALPARDFMGDAPATATGIDGDPIGLTPSPVALRYDAAAPADERLLIMAVDHSGSLIGEDPVNGGVDISRASDIRDARIAFLRTVNGLLPPDTFVSVVSFQGDLPTLDPEGSVPTRNRDISTNALSDLESGSTGTTPLAATLVAIRESVVAPNPDLRPSVLLFTDGIEDGDPTDPDGSRIDAEIEAYAAADITVHVLQLRPPVAAGTDRQRDPKLIELACRTGGEYAFIEDPSDFIAPTTNLANQLAARQNGIWRLTVDMPSLADLAAGWWAVAMRIQLQIGALEQQVDLRLNDDPEQAFDDTRLWLQRD